MKSISTIYRFSYSKMML